MNSTLSRIPRHNQAAVIKASCVNSKSKKYKYTGKEAGKIMSEYFKCAGTAVLYGQEWRFPKGFGTLKVVCEEVEKPQQIKTFVYRKGKGYRRKLAYNFKRFNLIYTFLLQSTFVTEHLFELDICTALRKKLYAILTKTNFNYQHK